MAKKIKSNCRVCGKKYEILFSEIESIPLWKYENCSVECSNKCSENRLVSKSTCSRRPFGDFSFTGVHDQGGISY